ncbi:neprilysin-like isoform X1 [Phycodurus eques]|uniref:neprilysin-like isoform X1 n=1 Tax=Phycodurus eques TaxID=693459 RepID=UPI002ACD74D6|nr:neprilysin-like isoform X1 [Phycodurus eques]
MPVYSIVAKFPDTSGDSIQLAAEGEVLTMTDNNAPKSAKKKHWTSLEVGLIAVVSLLVIIVVTLIILFATLQTDKICTTADCTWSAARLIENMDASVDPCDNFYQYACGGWLKKNIIPETSPRYSTFAVLRDELTVVLKGVLEKKVEGEANALSKAKTLYKSCTNESLTEQKGGAPLLMTLPDVFEWPMAVDNWDTDYGKRWRAEDVIAKLTVKYQNPLLVSMYVDVDERDSKSHIIHFEQQHSLDLWSKSYYACNGSYEEACRLYELFVIDLVKLIRTDRGLSFNETLVREEVTRIMELEKGIAEANDPPSVSSDRELRYNKMELADLNANFTLEVDTRVNCLSRLVMHCLLRLSILPLMYSSLPVRTGGFVLKLFNWSYFTAQIMNTVNITVMETEEVINLNPNYFRRLNQLLARYTKRDVQNYLMWRFASQMVVHLSKAYRDTAKAFKKAMNGATAEEPVWRQCAGFVNGAMYNAVGRLYVQEAFSDNSKKMMEEMITEIRDVFISNLKELTWMDAVTKKAAEEKVRAIREQIGYADNIMDDKYLNDEYKDLNYTAEEFFENIVHTAAFNNKKILQKLRVDVNKDEWVSGAAIINAFYSWRKNIIIFPAGILQPPFFSKGQAKSLNYGGIGMVIGHEVMHGFDNIGRKYDKNGDLKDWWTEDSAQRFLELSACIVDQYANFSWDLANGLNLKGNNTLGENIADNGGVRQAYQAYKNYVKKHGEEALLPGLNLNHDQLFFLNFAQVWCGTRRPEDALNSIQVDQHSPGKFRVLGSLQNFPEFAKVYGCNRSSYMVSDNVCRVW